MRAGRLRGRLPGPPFAPGLGGGRRFPRGLSPHLVEEAGAPRGRLGQMGAQGCARRRWPGPRGPPAGHQDGLGPAQLRTAGQRPSAAAAGLPRRCRLVDAPS
eukprot:14662203-Alexandrium_andersonii.AAC.1